MILIDRNSNMNAFVLFSILQFNRNTGINTWCYHNLFPFPINEHFSYTVRIHKFSFNLSREISFERLQRV